MGLLSHLKRKPTPQSPLAPAAPITIIGERRHRTDIPYLLPKDFQEDNRLDFQHFFLKGIFGKLYFASIKDPVNVLDVGCGTGRWCIDMAQHLPSTWITGVDIEFHLPPIPIPERCHFITGDILGHLPFPDHHFSFVHQRFLGSAIPLASWPAAISELKRVCRPGGYVELFEGGAHFINPGPHTKNFLAWRKLLSSARGIDVDQLVFIGVWMKKAGLREMQIQTMQVPIGQHGGNAGVKLQQTCLAGWSALKGIICCSLHVDPLFFETTIEALPGEWAYYKTAYLYYSAFGRK